MAARCGCLAFEMIEQLFDEGTPKEILRD